MRGRERVLRGQDVVCFYHVSCYCVCVLIMIIVLLAT